MHLTYASLTRPLDSGQGFFTYWQLAGRTPNRPNQSGNLRVPSQSALAAGVVLAMQIQQNIGSLTGL